jgi:hypothetical protein
MNTFLALFYLSTKTYTILCNILKLKHSEQCFQMITNHWVVKSNILIFFHLKKLSNSNNKTVKKDEKEEVLNRDAFRIYFVSFIQQGGEK